jgi:hypothetical protein
MCRWDDIASIKFIPLISNAETNHLDRMQQSLAELWFPGLAIGSTKDDDKSPAPRFLRLALILLSLNLALGQH